MHVSPDIVCTHLLRVERVSRSLASVSTRNPAAARFRLPALR